MLSRAANGEWIVTVLGKAPMGFDAAMQVGAVRGLIRINGRASSVRIRPDLPSA